MPVYGWKGQAYGLPIEGELEVESQAIALALLRERGVMVQELIDHDTGDRTPIAPMPVAPPPFTGSIDPEPLTDRPARARAAGPRPMAGLLMGTGFMIGAAWASTLAPVVFVDCVRGRDQPVTCTVSETLLGVYPWAETTLSPVTTATPEATGMMLGRDRGSSRVGAYQLVLRDGSGQEARTPAWDRASVFGDDGPSMQSRVRTLIDDPSPGRASMWQVAWGPLLAVVPILLLGGLMLALGVAGLRRRPAD